MANLRNTNASVSTTTIDKNEFDQKTENNNQGDLAPQHHNFNLHICV